MKINIKDKIGNSNVKQIVVIRKDLKLSKTEMLTQSNYATSELIKSFMKRDKQFLGKNIKYVIETELNSALDILLSKADNKEFFIVDSEDELLHLYNKVKISNIPVVLIEDSSLRGSKKDKVKTCICIGPVKEEEISKIVGHLQSIQ